MQFASEANIKYKHYIIQIHNAPFLTFHQSIFLTSHVIYFTMVAKQHHAVLVLHEGVWVTANSLTQSQYYHLKLKAMWNYSPLTNHCAQDFHVATN